MFHSTMPKLARRATILAAALAALLLCAGSTDAARRESTARKYATLIGTINLHKRGTFTVRGCQVDGGHRLYFKVSSKGVPVTKPAPAVVNSYGFFWLLVKTGRELVGVPRRVRDDRTVEIPVGHSDAGFVNVGFGVVVNGIKESVSAKPIPIATVKSC